MKEHEFKLLDYSLAEFNLVLNENGFDLAPLVCFQAYHSSETLDIFDLAVRDTLGEAFRTFLGHIGNSKSLAPSPFTTAISALTSVKIEKRPHSQANLPSPPNRLPISPMPPSSLATFSDDLPNHLTDTKCFLDLDTLTYPENKRLCTTGSFSTLSSGEKIVKDELINY